MKTILLFLVFLFSFLTSYAQCPTENTAFKAGESLTYDLYFNWKFIWVKCGTAHYTMKSATYKGQPALRNDLLFTSNKRCDAVFPMRDTLISCPSTSAKAHLKASTTPLMKCGTPIPKERAMSSSTSSTEMASGQNIIMSPLTATTTCSPSSPLPATGASPPQERMHLGLPPHYGGRLVRGSFSPWQLARRWRPRPLSIVERKIGKPTTKRPTTALFSPSLTTKRKRRTKNSSASTLPMTLVTCLSALTFISNSALPKPIWQKAIRGGFICCKKSFHSCGTKGGRLKSS